MTSPALQETTLAIGMKHAARSLCRNDKMGIVYYANYLVWFEIGRTEYCRARAFLIWIWKRVMMPSWSSQRATGRYKARRIRRRVIDRTHITGTQASARFDSATSFSGCSMAK